MEELDLVICVYACDTILKYKSPITNNKNE